MAYCGDRTGVGCCLCGAVAGCAYCHGRGTLRERAGARGLLLLLLLLQ